MSSYITPQHIFIGKDALAEAATHIKNSGKRALIVTGKHVGKSPMYKDLVKLLEGIQVSYRTFDGITGEPTDTMIEEGVELYKKANCDFCIGIGGGSPLDSAKAIAAMAVLPGKITDYNGRMITGEVPPIVAIPTTSGTGSEATMFTVITDTKMDIKMLLKGESLVPKIAIVNTDFSMDMPKSVTAATGLDAFTHAVEAFTSKKAFSLTDTLAVDAIQRILTYLPIAYENGYDAKARGEMAIAALEAGICINNSSVTLVHGMSRPIGAMFHVPHGMSNAMLLKECMRFALDGAYDKFAHLARVTNAATKEDSDKIAAEMFLYKIEELLRACEIPTLQEFGIDETEFISAIDKMSRDAIASGSPGNTRKEVTKEDCTQIYKRAYKCVKNF